MCRCTKWADKTEDEILADITGMLKQVARTTKKVEKPDTLALPSEAYIEIQNRRIESTATTVLKYIQDNITDISSIVSRMRQKAMARALRCCSRTTPASSPSRTRCPSCSTRFSLKVWRWSFPARPAPQALSSTTPCPC